MVEAAVAAETESEAEEDDDVEIVASAFAGVDANTSSVDSFDLEGIDSDEESAEDVMQADAAASSAPRCKKRHRAKLCCAHHVPAGCRLKVV